MIKLLTKLLFLVLILPSLVFGADLYCDFTNGNDANDCTNGTTQLCKTLQKCVDVATGGDTLNIANTSAQVLTASITWNTGFTADNTKYTIFQAWDNGGSLTIQRPDEAVARVASVIDGGGVVVKFLTFTPPRLSFKNIRFTAFTGFSPDSHGGEAWVSDGCEYTGFTGASRPVYLRGGDQIFNAYIHTNTTTQVAANVGTSSTVSITNSWIENTSNAVIINVDNATTIIEGNKIIFNASNKEGIKGNNNLGYINRNTFIGSGLASQIGIAKGTSNASQLTNNIFYNFNGASSSPAELGAGVGKLIIFGHNAFYDSNAPTMPAAGRVGTDLAANDITGTGDPFVDSANNDYTLKSDSLARGAGLSNPNSSLDIGAVQSASTGGGGGGGYLHITGE